MITFITCKAPCKEEGEGVGVKGGSAGTVEKEVERSDSNGNDCRLT